MMRIPSLRDTIGGRSLSYRWFVLAQVMLLGCTPSQSKILVSRDDQVKNCGVARPTYGTVAACLVAKYDWPADSAQLEGMLFEIEEEKQIKAFRDSVYMAATAEVRSEARRLSAAQAKYFSVHRRFASNIEQMGFRLKSGLEMYLDSNSGNGLWEAELASREDTYRCKLHGTSMDPKPEPVCVPNV